MKKSSQSTGQIHDIAFKIAYKNPPDDSRPAVAVL